MVPRTAARLAWRSCRPRSSPAPRAASDSPSPARSPAAAGGSSSTRAAPARSQAATRRARRRRRRRPPRRRHRRRAPAARSSPPRAASVDLLVNNASVLGPSPQPPLADYPLDALEHVYAVNVLAPLALIQLALPQLAGGRAHRQRDLRRGRRALRGLGRLRRGQGGARPAHRDAGRRAPDLRVYAVDPGDMRTRLHQEAFPGEDISDRPLPEGSVPGLLALIEATSPAAATDPLLRRRRPESELSIDRRRSSSASRSSSRRLSSRSASSSRRNRGAFSASFASTAASSRDGRLMLPAISPDGPGSSGTSPKHAQPALKAQTPGAIGVSLRTP